VTEVQQGLLARRFRGALLQGLTLFTVATLVRMGRTIVVDFDGTITERDTLIAIEEEFGEPDAIAHLDALFDDGKITLQQEIVGKFEHVHAPFEVVRDWVLEHARVRPGLQELVALARDRGWRVVVVSSGFEELIRPVLEREGVAVDVRANRIDTSGGNWRVVWTYGDACDTCGESCKRSLVRELADGAEVVYVGDGYSDRCAALASDRVFATKGLASYLEERGAPFHRFDDFHDVVAAL
jgi:2-hydroxy-3-keto-5-methylthiopentenyl-1-phosphate phosphatase